MTPKQLERLLSQPDYYPHPVETPIRRIDTHISTIWLTGKTAYKVKKPVDFGFVDFSTRERRCYFCEREIALNRRFAPRIYQRRVWLTPEGIRTSRPPTDTDYECAVQMAQFDPDALLSRYLRRHTLAPEQIAALGRALAQFHRQAQTVPEDLPWGLPERVLQPMTDNFPALFQYHRASDAQERLRQLKAWTERRWDALRDALLRRRRNGHIRACHGDLHLDNIAMLEGVPVPFDGIEFNEQFRWIDPISDLAFPIMSLEHIGHTVSAVRLLHYWLEETGDDEAIPLLRFYGVYRALVRAKIATLCAAQQADSECRARTLEQARAFIDTATRWALNPPKPFLIVMQGIAGSGKSYHARRLAQSRGAVVISSDIERKRLAGLPPLYRPSEEEKRSLYSPQMSERTYRRLLDMAEKLLRQHIPVILDATYLKAEHRAAPLALAQSLGVPAEVFKLKPDIERCRENIRKRREAGDDPSDADERIMEMQAKIFED